MNKESAAAEIDRVLTACVVSARPVYLTLPTDLVYVKIPSGRLATSLPTFPPENEKDTEEFVLDEILALIKEAKEDAVILVDACSIRHHVLDETRELVERTGFPVYSAPMGKGAISEWSDRYGGVSSVGVPPILHSIDLVVQIYVGSLTHEEIKDKVEQAKLIISVGALKSDFNTGNFTYSIPTSRTVEVCILYSPFPDYKYSPSHSATFR